MGVQSLYFAHFVKKKNPHEIEKTSALQNVGGFILGVEIRLQNLHDFPVPEETCVFPLQGHYRLKTM